jgi:hypothetical protein
MRPLKPWGWPSRRCRGRTWKSRLDDAGWPIRDNFPDRTMFSPPQREEMEANVPVNCERLHAARFRSPVQRAGAASRLLRSRDGHGLVSARSILPPAREPASSGNSIWSVRIRGGLGLRDPFGSRICPVARCTRTSRSAGRARTAGRSDPPGKSLGDPATSERSPHSRLAR